MKHLGARSYGVGRAPIGARSNAGVRGRGLDEGLPRFRRGHTLDALTYVLGDIEAVSATIGNPYPSVTVLETGQTQPQTTPSQIAMSGSLAGGVPFVGQLRGGRKASSDLLLEIIGKKGELRITSVGNIQMSDLALSLDDDGTVSPDDEAIEDDLQSLVGTPALNVARNYRHLATAIAGRPAEFPDFRDALRTHRLLDAIERADEVEQQQHVTQS